MHLTRTTTTVKTVYDTLNWACFVSVGSGICCQDSMDLQLGSLIFRDTVLAGSLVRDFLIQTKLNLQTVLQVTFSGVGGFEAGGYWNSSSCWNWQWRCVICFDSIEICLQQLQVQLSWFGKEVSQYWSRCLKLAGWWSLEVQLALRLLLRVQLLGRAFSCWVLQSQSCHHFLTDYHHQ